MSMAHSGVNSLMALFAHVKLHAPPIRAHPSPRSRRCSGIGSRWHYSLGLRDALLDAGASPEKADKAAEELASYENRLGGILWCLLAHP
jgi:hypothetical protein